MIFLRLIEENRLAALQHPGKGQVVDRHVSFIEGELGRRAAAGEQIHFVGFGIEHEDAGVVEGERLEHAVQDDLQHIAEGLGQVALGDDAVEDLDLLGAGPLGLLGQLALADVLHRAFIEDLPLVVAYQLGVLADMEEGTVFFRPDRFQPLDLAVALQALDEIGARVFGMAGVFFQVADRQLGEGIITQHGDQGGVGVDDAAVGGGAIDADGHVLEELAIALLARLQGLFYLLVALDVDDDQLARAFLFIDSRRHRVFIAGQLLDQGFFYFIVALGIDDDQLARVLFFSHF